MIRSISFECQTNDSISLQYDFKNVYGVDLIVYRRSPPFRLYPEKVNYERPPHAWKENTRRTSPYSVYTYYRFSHFSKKGHDRKKLFSITSISVLSIVIPFPPSAFATFCVIQFSNCSFLPPIPLCTALTENSIL